MRGDASGGGAGGGECTTGLQLPGRQLAQCVQWPKIPKAVWIFLSFEGSDGHWVWGVSKYILPARGRGVWGAVGREMDASNKNYSDALYVTVHISA